MTTKERSERDAAILAKYIREIKHYRAVWGLPPSREVHLNAWSIARKSN
jgi:hypothetical protein